ncbi:uncharacterized protein LOC133791646 [Humulus lupulus]|uniref:uncharacterized protein LOC133791646 n=1 Tax=Humulus lupulus TaxID=3486 RepID=UPI002B4158E4|nr:uncharacterized protein LOC133791646 [Humulus lupulus]
MDGKQQIEHIFLRKNIKYRISYRVRLIASVDCIRFLVRQGLAFRGHDESQESNIQVDESRDVSIKEQMVVMFRYVDKRGCVIERFIGIEHVPNTTTISLKIAIDKLFSKHGLSISKLRGQGYDGASNMSGEFNGLKSTFLTVVSNVVNVVGASSKRHDILREKQALKVI